MFVEQAPIPVVAKEIQDEIELLVDKLQIPNDNIEREIDDIVYSIYDLSAEEIDFLTSNPETKAISSSSNE